MKNFANPPVTISSLIVKDSVMVCRTNALDAPSILESVLIQMMETSKLVMCSKERI